MGSPESQRGSNPDETHHQVKISQPFYLGMHEVTLNQFLKFYHDAKYKTEGERDGQGGWGYTGYTFKQLTSYAPWSWGHPDQTNDHPVVNVSWNDAVAFCQWLSKKEGKKYALPTEAQWEYACRAGTTTLYASGTESVSLVGNANFADQNIKNIRGINQDHTYGYASFDDRFAFTAPVGSFKPNAFGLYAMHGNVYEWCQDWYGTYPNGSVTDPKGPTSGSMRVYRGGSWLTTPLYVRSSFRNRYTPDYRHLDLGFRVAVPVQ